MGKICHRFNIGDGHEGVIQVFHIVCCMVHVVCRTLYVAVHIVVQGARHILLHAACRTFHAARCLVQGARRMAHFAWRVVHALMVQGAWCMAHAGARLMLSENGHKQSPRHCCYARRA